MTRTFVLPQIADYPKNRVIGTNSQPSVQNLSALRLNYQLSSKAMTLRTDVSHLANAGAASQWIAACPAKSSKPLPVGSLSKRSDKKTYP